ncbi:hypothetical protein ACE38W_02730 [Chitinophaga sp. Hz27]|uniref:hypothetical protein n=1 Tax=Chitinophaga sp. Hz27 TaxID=3347169 RepID=UPI0035D9530A
MVEVTGIWGFSGVMNDENTDKPYQEVRRDLRILLSNLISTGILIPRKINNEVLVYETLDQLLEIIANSGRLDKSSRFNITGDTVIFTSAGSDIHHGIVTIEDFRTYEQFFMLKLNTDIWMPLVYDKEECEFSWNLDLYNRNYERIPTLLKQLDLELNWSSKSFLNPDGWLTTEQVGYDFFLMKDVVEREYRDNPNPNFNPVAYLEKARKAKEPYKDSYGK